MLARLGWNTHLGNGRSYKKGTLCNVVPQEDPSGEVFRIELNNGDWFLDHGDAFILLSPLELLARAVDDNIDRSIGQASQASQVKFSL